MTKVPTRLLKTKTTRHPSRLVKNMNTLNGKIPTRQQLLRAWMLERALTLEDLARAAGVSPQRLSYAFKQKTVRTALHDRLTAAGVPANLLPLRDMSKAQLLAENQELKARLAQAEAEPASLPAA